MYSEWLHKAVTTFGISREEARKRYGQFTIRQWEKLFKATYRIRTAEGKFLNAGTDRPSWFTLEQARKLVNRSAGETIVESDGVNILWEVF